MDDKFEVFDYICEEALAYHDIVISVDDYDIAEESTFKAFKLTFAKDLKKDLRHAKRLIKEGSYKEALSLLKEIEVDYVKFSKEAMKELPSLVDRNRSENNNSSRPLEVISAGASYIITTFIALALLVLSISVFAFMQGVHQTREWEKEYNETYGAYGKSKVTTGSKILMGLQFIKMVLKNPEAKKAIAINAGIISLTNVLSTAVANATGKNKYPMNAFMPILANMQTNTLVVIRNLQTRCREKMEEQKQS